MKSNASVADNIQAAPLKEKVAKQRKWCDLISSHVRRVSLEVLNVFFNHDWLFWVIGLINKRIGLIKSVFLVYPANEDYALAYVYTYRLAKVRWNPWPCGLLWQNGKLSVMFCVSASNGQFSDPQNLEKVSCVAERMEKLRLLMGADNKTFAGILPGVLYCRRIIREAPEAELTAVAVYQAIGLVKTRELLSDNTPIIVLGGRGFIGRRVIKLLGKLPVFCVDIAEGRNREDWPYYLRGKRVMVVNITLNNALANYVNEMWPGTVIVNEVYPEPSLEVLEQLKQKGCVCYHVVGVRAFAWPSFPAAYRGAIPCCAAWSAPDMEVVVRKIN